MSNRTSMRTVILCGGKGTRAYPHTVEVPKPLLEVSDRPVLLHLMEIYAAQGFSDFVLAAGYKLPLIEAFADEVPPEWKVEVVDTGPDTNTGRPVPPNADRGRADFFLPSPPGRGHAHPPP